MIPTKYNITVFRGRDFLEDFIFYDDEENLLPIDTWVFKSEIREEECPESNLLASFTINVFPDESRISLNLTDQETLLLQEGTAYWDLLVTRGSMNESFLCGKVKIKCCVTEV